MVLQCIQYTDEARGVLEVARKRVLTRFTRGAVGGRGLMAGRHEAGGRTGMMRHTYLGLHAMQRMVWRACTWCMDTVGDVRSSRPKGSAHRSDTTI